MAQHDRSNRARLDALAARIGCSVERNGREVLVMAPVDHCYMSDCHEHVNSPWSDESEARMNGVALARLQEAEPYVVRCSPDTCLSWNDEANDCGWWMDMRKYHSNKAVN